VNEVRPITVAGAGALVVFALSGEYGHPQWFHKALSNAADTFKLRAGDMPCRNPS
jgi:hypothetical protein